MQTLELLIEPRVGGEVYLYNPSTLSLATERLGAPATLTGEIPDTTGAPPQMGSTVRLRVDGKLVFYGYLFSATLDRWGVLQFTAYDQLRYLKGNISWYQRGMTIEDLIGVIKKIYPVKFGRIDATGYKARERMIQNECALDALQEMIDLATVYTKKAWVLYDDCGEICLRNCADLVADLVIGENSLATEYSLATDIDSDTFNYIALHRPLSGGGVMGNKFAKDEQTEKQWGRLVYWEEVDENMNSSRMQIKADNLLKLKYRPPRSLSISCLGVVGIRAGMMATIDFPSLPSISKKQQVILDTVSHTFEQSIHTMEITTRTFWDNSPSEE